MTDADNLAKEFHERYEVLAPKHSYETRIATAVPWDQVPENNKALMTEVAQSLLDDGIVSNGGYDSRPETWEHIHQVRRFMLIFMADLHIRSQEHDQSKLNEPEVGLFNEYTLKLRHSTYMSEEYKSLLQEMGAALQHHYAMNSHHPEHFVDGVAGMTLVDVVEMLCDWMAAVSRVKDGDIFRSLEQNQDRFGFSDDLRQIMENTVRTVYGKQVPSA